MPKQSIALTVLAALCSLPAAAEESKSHAAPAAIGSKVAGFSLRDFRGQNVSLAHVGQDKIVVLAFLGTECPLAKTLRLAPRRAGQGI